LRSQRALLGVLGQGDERVADEVGHRLGAGDVEQNAQPRQLRLVQLAPRLARDDVGQEVVARQSAPLGQVRGQILAQLACGRPRRLRQPIARGVAVDDRAQPSAQHVLILHRKSKQTRHRAHGNRPRKRVGGIEPTFARRDRQHAAHVLPDRRLHRSDPRRREPAAHDPPQSIVIRRIRSDEVPRPGQRQGVIEIHPVGAREPRPLPRRPLHVVEPTESPEPTRLVAIDRTRRPQLPISRVRLILHQRIERHRHTEIESLDRAGAQARLCLTRTGRSRPPGASRPSRHRRERLRRRSVRSRARQGTPRRPRTGGHRRRWGAASRSTPTVSTPSARESGTARR
jgi:hypothetical protein